MPVRWQIDLQIPEHRLRCLEACANAAPFGSHTRAKKMVMLINKLGRDIPAAVLAVGEHPPEGDRLREVKAMLYAQLRESAGDPEWLKEAEEYGRLSGDHPIRPEYAPERGPHA